MEFHDEGSKYGQRFTFAITNLYSLQMYGLENDQCLTYDIIDNNYIRLCYNNTHRWAQENHKQTLTCTTRIVEKWERERITHLEKQYIYIYFNPPLANFFRGNKNIYLHFVIPPHRHDTGSWNPSSSKLRTYQFYIVNIMGADVLATQGARASATMIFTVLNSINLVPAR